MPSPDFGLRLSRAQQSRSSLVCVGLDPDPDRLPPHLLRAHDLPEAVLAFNRAIIESTAPAASAYKLNLAFYEVLRRDYWRILEETLAAIPEDAITIADGKRGDIGNSARFYAKAAFELLDFDACTVSGYMGRDSVAPFLEHEGRGVFLLVRTSNPGALDFQELSCGDKKLFEHVAHVAGVWGDDLGGSIGFVVGATNVDALKTVRQICPSEPLLIPGVGAQGGNAKEVVRIAADRGAPVIINSSRAIIYATSGRDFANAAGDAAESLRVSLESFRT